MRNRAKSGQMALEAVLRLRRIGVDEVRSEIAELGIGEREMEPAEMLGVCKRLGVRIKRKEIGLAEIGNRYPLPVIIEKKAGGYGVVLGIREGEKVLELRLPEMRVVQRGIKDLEGEIGGVYVVGYRRGETESSEGLRWFVGEIKGYWGIMAEVLAGTFVLQMLGIVTPLFTQVIIDKVLVQQSMTTLRVMVAGYIIAIVFEGILNVSRNYIFVHTTNKIDAKIGGKIYRHLMRLYYVYFENRPVGNIIMRIREMDRIREFITEKSVSVVIDAVFSVVFCVVMLIYSVKLTILAGIFMVLTGSLYVLLTPEIRSRLEERYRMSSKQNSYLVETITGMQTVKSLGIEGEMNRRWEEKLSEYIETGYRLTMLGKVTGAIGQMLQRGMLIGILYIGVTEVIGGRMTVGQLIAFQMIAGQFSGPMVRLLGLWNEIQQTMLSLERAGEILQSPEEGSGMKGIRKEGIRGEIKISGVGFRYGVEGPAVLRGLEMDIGAGQCIGIAGRSGSGKSTIAKLLQRLYYATEGAIYIDGIDIRNMDPWWLRREIGIVMQESYLFSGSIRENIEIVSPGVSMERIVEVSRRVGADEFIRRLPKGYETEVGERGSALSGGQKQRIAIARALITDPRILIMDEATSSLDYESERIIRENMDYIRGGRTTIIIAHRLSTLRDCDCIYCMEEGRVVESGSHSELIKKGGYYSRMNEMQEG